MSILKIEGKEAQGLFINACNRWGINNQLIAAVEELSELSVELTKLVLGKRDIEKMVDLKKVVDELADASIMIEQTIFNLSVKIHPFPSVQDNNHIVLPL